MSRACVTTERTSATWAQLLGFHQGGSGVATEQGALALRGASVIEEVIRERERSLLDMGQAKAKASPLERYDNGLPAVIELPRPDRLDDDLLDALLGEGGDDLEAAVEARSKAKARNSGPFLKAVAKPWREGRPALVLPAWVGKRLESAIQFRVPSVRRLPKIPSVFLDATGDPALIQRVTGLPPRVVTGKPNPVKGTLIATPAGRASAGSAISIALAAAARAFPVREGVTVGLVTFKAATVGAEAAFREAGFQVLDSLHFGGLAGSNAFAGKNKPDLLVVIGTPRPPPAAYVERAVLVENEVALFELEQLGRWSGDSLVLSPPLQRAYVAMVHASAEQGLGRGSRDRDQNPVLLAVLEDFPTTVGAGLRRTTPRDEGLRDDAGNLLGLCGHPGIAPDLERAMRGEGTRLTAREFVKAMIQAQGLFGSSERQPDVSRETWRDWGSGRRLPPAHVLEGTLQARCAPLIEPIRGAHRSLQHSAIPHGSWPAAVLAAIGDGSAAGLAGRVGVHPATVGRWSRGETEPGEGDQQKILDLLELEVTQPDPHAAVLRMGSPELHTALEVEGWKLLSRSIRLPEAESVYGEARWTKWGSMLLEADEVFTWEATLLRDGRVLSEAWVLDFGNLDADGLPPLRVLPREVIAQGEDGEWHREPLPPAQLDWVGDLVRRLGLKEVADW